MSNRGHCLGLLRRQSQQSEEDLRGKVEVWPLFSLALPKHICFLLCFLHFHNLGGKYFASASHAEGKRALKKVAFWLLLSLCLPRYLWLFLYILCLHTLRGKKSCIVSPQQSEEELYRCCFVSLLTFASPKYIRISFALIPLSSAGQVSGPSRHCRSLSYCTAVRHILNRDLEG